MSKRQVVEEEIGSPIVVKRNKLAPGKELHIQTPDYEEEPRPISMAEAKRLLKAYRKPRQMTEEGRAKMLENLAKGREKRQANLKQLTEEKEQVVTRKYKIKPRATPTPAKQIQKRPIEEEENNTDDELYEKIAKKERMLRKLQELQQLAQAQQKPKPQAQLRPRYSMFY